MSGAPLIPLPSGEPATVGSRQLPHRLEAEKSVLGGVLLYPRCLSEIVDLVAADDFFHPAHGEIYRALCDLLEQHRPIDDVSLGEQLRKADKLDKMRAIGGESYFAELTSSVVTVENVAYHATLIRKWATARRLIETAHSIAAEGYQAHIDVD